jgi:hypothetical protein
LSARCHRPSCEAITCPAEAAGLDIEPGLTELLLADLHAGSPTAGNTSQAADDGAGRLPLLAHALQVTWQQRHGSTLTVEGYRAAGGIEHAIADSAERVFARLDAVAQQKARALFLRLVKIGDTSGEDIRRPVIREGLAGGTAGAVIDAYTAARLLTQARDAVQITHEALLTAWPRLAGWLDEDRAGQLMRQRTEDDAADWDRALAVHEMLQRRQVPSRLRPKPQPLEVIAPGAPVEEVIARLTAAQAVHPGAQVRQGSGGLGIWPAPAPGQPTPGS